MTERLDDLLDALRHPDVDLPAFDEATRRSLVRLGVLPEDASNERVLPLDKFAVLPGEVRSKT